MRTLLLPHGNSDGGMHVLLRLARHTYGKGAARADQDGRTPRDPTNSAPLHVIDELPLNSCSKITSRIVIHTENTLRSRSSYTIYESDLIH